MKFHLAWLLLFLTLAPALYAKDKKWEQGYVVMVAGAMPQRGGYWIRGDRTTYVIHNYANTSMLVAQWWVYLTLGGEAQIFSDGKNLHVIDNQGKERKCQILQSMSNAYADAYVAKEAAKTPQEQAQDRAEEREAAMQRSIIQLETLRMIQARRQADRPTKVDVQVKDCTKYPALCD